ncbi:dephospho-CoA kinase [Methylocapsa acidiphila]|uniref:dephospho-CoA kinase n=1 Tax=Methylocapsa acidiphila TaxID=133552 RepID=UPI000422EA31|nr:dephospho-CoA kinase [Methylocapsa acidiphila]
MFVLGLTGSIGMGKSTTAAMFRAEGVPVHDSDTSVHQLYRGPAAPVIEAAFPGTTREGVVDRSALAARVFEDPAALRRLESIVHPLVTAARQAFLVEAAKTGARVVVLDVPLLFETGLEGTVDAVIVVTAPETVQKARAATRPGMTPERLAAILAKQMPDAEKRARAHFIIDTSSGFAAAERQVRGVLRALAGPANKSRSQIEH